MNVSAIAPRALCLTLLAAAVSGALAAGCAAPIPEDVATTPEALTFGFNTTYPVVEITAHNGANSRVCTGTSLSDTWVLTSAQCGFFSGSALTTSYTVESVPNAWTVQAASAVSNANVTLLHLASALAVGSYPIMSTIPLVASQLTCTGTLYPAGTPEQDDYAITTVAEAGGTAISAAPLHGAIVQADDIGGACFNGDGSIAAVEASCVAGGSCSLTAALDFDDFIYANVGAAPFCGTWKCGQRPAGSQSANCGTCQTPGTVCSNAGTCVAQTTSTGGGVGSGGGTCPRGLVDCGDGECVPHGHACE